MRVAVIFFGFALLVGFGAPALAGPPACTPKLVGHDLNADGNADLLLESTTLARVNTMSGTTVLGTGWPSTANGAYKMGASGDLNNDGKADIGWQGQSGTGALGVLRFNIMDGVNSTSTGWASDAGGLWLLFAFEDLNADGKADAIYKGQGSAIGSVKVVIMDGATEGASGLISTGGGTWNLVDVADLNNDGKADLIFDGGVNGMRLNLMDGTASTSQGFVGTAGGTWAYQGVGDFDGDGNADLLYRYSNALRFDFMNGASVASNGWNSVSPTWVLQGIIDTSNDCKADIVYASASQLRIDTMDGATITGTGYAGLGGGTYTPAGAADLDGDGNADILLDGTSDLRVLMMNGTAVASTGSVTNAGGTLLVAPIR